MSNPNMPSQEPDAIKAGENIPLAPDSPAALAFQASTQRAAENGAIVPELPAVGTSDKVLDGPRETGSYTRPDGVTVDSRIVGGAKETQIHGMGSQHNLPTVAENPFTRKRREAEEAQAAIEAAAVRHPATPQNEAMRQMDIAAADRTLRKDQGLPPPSADLR